MPLFLFLIAVALLVLLTILSMPLLLIQRYRIGTSRRRARGWVAAVNLYGGAFSAAIFLTTAAITNIWLPRAFIYSVAGLAGGMVLGLLGLLLSHWETTPDSLHFTPNRWLVLAITLVVSARIAYGFWRGWNAWGTTPEGGSWLVASGAAGSLGAGGVIIGYYLSFWLGISRRLKKLLQPG